MARQYQAVLPLDTVDWIVDGPSYRLGQWHCMPWELCLVVTEGRHAPQRWREGTCRAHRGRRECGQGKRERSGGEDTIFREKQMNKVNGVPVLVIRQPPSSCVKSLFCSNCSGDFLFVTGKEDPKPKILLKPPPSGSHLGFPGSRRTPSFRQLMRGVGTPWAWQDSRAVRFTEMSTAVGPGWMVGAAGEEQRAGLGACGSEGMGGREEDTHCGSPRGKPRWCCLRCCGPCSCSLHHRLCSAPAA